MKAKTKRTTVGKRKKSVAAGRKKPKRVSAAAKRPKCSPTTRKRVTRKKVTRKKVMRKKASRSTTTRQQAQKRPKGIRPGYAVPPQVSNAKLTRAELSRLRQRLLEERKRLVDEIRRLSGRELDLGRDETSPVANRLANHLADIATDSQMAEALLVQSGMEANELRQVEEALERIEDKTYGICERCGANIGFARLWAKPSARLCIVCRAELERRMI